MDITHFSICLYDKYHSKQLCSTIYVYEVIICQSERSPEIMMICQTHTIGGNQNTSDGSMNIDKTLPAFG